MTTDILDPTEFWINDSICIHSESFDNNSNTECLKNPLDNYRCSANETVLVNTPCEKKFISISLVGNVILESRTNDVFCEELSHPHLFPTGIFGFQTKRKVSLSPSNILIGFFKLHTEICPCLRVNTFCSLSLMQMFNLGNQINISMGKVSSNQLTAGMHSSNFSEKVK